MELFRWLNKSSTISFIISMDIEPFIKGLPHITSAKLSPKLFL